MTTHIDPTLLTPAGVEIRNGAESLAALSVIDIASLVSWVTVNPTLVPILGLTVGLSREKLKNSVWSMRCAPSVRAHTILGISWSRAQAREVLLSVRGHQVGESRIRSKQSPATWDCSTKHARGLLVATGERHPVIWSFHPDRPPRSLSRRRDLTRPGPKLTDAVREIEEMADVRLPRQVVMAVIDGIGWKSRQADLKRIYSLWEFQQIDGMYTIASLSDFRADVEEAATLRKLLPEL
jgi:hypothetical protein